MDMLQNIRQKGKDGQRAMPKIVVQNAGMIVLLMIASLYNGSQPQDHNVVVSGAPTVTLRNFQCTSYDRRVYYAITAYFGMTIAWGVLITSKAFGAVILAHSLWSNSSKTWEIRLISYAIYVMSAVLTAVLIFSPYSGESNPAYLHEIVCALIISQGTLIALSVMWVPKVVLIYHEWNAQARTGNERPTAVTLPTRYPLKPLVLEDFPRRSKSSSFSGANSGSIMRVRTFSTTPHAEILTDMPNRLSFRFFAETSSTPSPASPKSTRAAEDVFRYDANSGEAKNADESHRDTPMHKEPPRIPDQVQELEQLLCGRSKEKDQFLEHCLHEHNIENVNFLIAFVDAQNYWQVCGLHGNMLALIS
jgi:hypothetical protein